MFGAEAGRAKPERQPRSVTASLFRKLVEDRGEAPAAPCTVIGAVDLSNAHFRQCLAFNRVRFEADFFADVATFASLAFTDCEFAGKLDLRNCRIGGSLRLSGCRFPAAAATEAAEPPALLFLGGSRIDGNVELDRVTLAGVCSLGGSVVGGDLQVEGLTIDAPVGSGPLSSDKLLSLDNMRVAGAITLIADAQPAGVAAAAARWRVAGNVSAYGATCHSFYLHSAQIEGGCDFSGLKVATTIEITESGFADLNLDHLVAGQVLGIYECTVAGRLGFSGATVPAQLRIASGDYGDIIFNGSKIGSFWVGNEDKVTCTRISATNSTFSSYVKMTRLTVRLAAAARTVPGPGIVRDDSGMIDIEHCNFGAMVTTWPVIGVDEIDGWGEGDFVTVERGFSFTDNDVGGLLSLTRLRAGGSRSSQAGFVRLDRTRVRGSFFISSPLAIARHRQAPDRTRRRAREIIALGCEDDYRARMRMLSMRKFAASAVELSGLDLVTCGLADEHRGDDGSLIGDRMEIAGRLETYVGEAHADGSAWRRARANIGGALKLRAAKIGELHLDGDSFRQRRGCLASQSGVVLEQAEIGLLRVPRSTTLRDPELNGFPVPLDLSGMTVRNWNFQEDVDAETRITADDFLDFLDNDEGLHREVYKSVARSLRDAGRDDDAEQVLYAEEYRARWEGRRPEELAGSEWPVRYRPFRILGRSVESRLEGRRPKPLIRLGRAFEPLDRVFLQYRRNPINLFWAMLLLFLFSVMFVSGHAANFELSERSRLVMQADGEAARFARGIDVQVDGENVGPNPAAWRFGDRVWMAARYHVPIVSVLAREEYVASSDAPFRVGIGGPFGRARLSFMTAEDWFALMSLLNWIMWPLLLTFLLRRALRSD